MLWYLNFYPCFLHKHMRQTLNRICLFAYICQFSSTNVSLKTNDFILLEEHFICTPVINCKWFAGIGVIWHTIVSAWKTWASLFSSIPSYPLPLRHILYALVNFHAMNTCNSLIQNISKLLRLFFASWWLHLYKTTLKLPGF